MMQIRTINPDERQRALELVLEVFMKYEVPDYSAEGAETFKASVIDNEDYLSQLVIYGAFDGEELLGVIATRNGGNHIALFFVDGAYQRRGIGKALFWHALQHSTSDEITVHSSPYAVEIYRRLGFIATSPERREGGMRYTPMLYKNA